MTTTHTEPAVVEGMATEIGRDTRKMTSAEITSLGHPKQSLVRIIRTKCIDCCAGSEIEVRRCRMIDCALWPYRLATNPHAKRDLSEKDRAEMAARFRRAVHRPKQTDGEEAG